MAFLGWEEEQKIAAFSAEGDRLPDRDIGRVRGACACLRVVDGLDERQRGLVEEGRVAALDLQQDIVQAEAGLEGDDVLDHAQVVVWTARAKHEVLCARPEVGDVHLGIQLLGMVHAANPPAGTLAWCEGQDLFLAALEGSDTGNGGFASQCDALGGERRSAVGGKANLVNFLFTKRFVGGGNGGLASEYGSSNLVFRHLHLGLLYHILPAPVRLAGPRPARVNLPIFCERAPLTPGEGVWYTSSYAKDEWQSWNGALSMRFASFSLILLSFVGVWCRAGAGVEG